MTRPTPRSTIEAVIYCVRTRGPASLCEPGNVERLSRCDPAALAEIRRRIACPMGHFLSERVSA
jgi:hypothetical protein